jgi:hypothetical protein
MLTQFSIHSLLSWQGKSLEAIWQMSKLSFKMLWTNKNEIHMLESSWTVTLLFSCTSVFAWSIFSSVLLIDGHPKYSATLTKITSLLNLENQAKSCVLAIFCSLKHTSNILKLSTVFFPSLEQNLMWTCCSFKSATFWVQKNYRHSNICLCFIR